MRIGFLIGILVLLSDYQCESTRQVPGSLCFPGVPCVGTYKAYHGVRRKSRQTSVPNRTRQHETEDNDPACILSSVQPLGYLPLTPGIYTVVFSRHSITHSCPCNHPPAAQYAQKTAPQAPPALSPAPPQRSL